jgi:hypothetical protein
METGVSYFSGRTPRHVRADLEDMVAHHCTYVVHCLTETDLLYHREAMREVIRATHEAGMEAWLDPWGVTGIFSGETLSRFPCDHPEAWQVLSDGRPVAAGCPNHPETRRFLMEWVKAAAETGGDVLFWDEPHFYYGPWRGDLSGAWACRCQHCQDRFRASTGRDLPSTLDDEVRAFRESSLLEMLGELCREGRRLGLRNALCLVPTDLEAVGLPELARGIRERWARAIGRDPEETANPLLELGVSDWEAAASLSDLEIFGTDPYWYLFGGEPEPFVRAFTTPAVEVSRRHGRQCQIWVQAFSVPEGREEELRVGLRVAAGLGATHLAAWSYEGTASMSVRCARPDLVWRILGEAFAEARGEGSRAHPPG